MKQANEGTMNVYRNTRYAMRNYECTNVVACVADKKPSPQWAECSETEAETILEKLTPLWIENGVRYYGYL
jgi:hypothetical protein